jgi:hypothetical protein
MQIKVIKDRISEDILIINREEDFKFLYIAYEMLFYYSSFKDNQNSKRYVSSFIIFFINIAAAYLMNICIFSF